MTVGGAFQHEEWEKGCFLIVMSCVYLSSWDGILSVDWYQRGMFRYDETFTLFFIEGKDQKFEI